MTACLATKRLLTASLLLIAVIVLPAFADPVVHQPTGITFPDEIAGFQRTGTQDYESKSPGLGFSYAYKSAKGAVATVYVYTGGEPPVPASVDDPAMGRQRDQATREVVQVAQLRGESAQHTLRGSLRIRSDRAEVPVLFDSFVISGAGLPRNTYVALWSSRSHFLKVRLTRMPGAQADSGAVNAFYEAVVRLAATTPDPNRLAKIELAKLASGTEMGTWMAYALGLSEWVRNHQLTQSEPDGPYFPSFDAELHARQKQLKVWQEVKGKLDGAPPPAYLDDMEKVQTADYLREYVWRYHRRRSWDTAPADLRVEDFAQWSSQHLREHRPQTGARIVFGPAVGGQEN